MAFLPRAVRVRLGRWLWSLITESAEGGMVRCTNAKGHELTVWSVVESRSGFMGIEIHEQRRRCVHCGLTQNVPLLDPRGVEL